MFYTYVLINKNKTRTYTGSTSHLERRLEAHNKGLVKSSKAYRPYEVLKFEMFETLKEAKEKELFYKSRTGRRFLVNIVENWKKQNI